MLWRRIRSRIGEGARFFAGALPSFLICIALCVALSACGIEEYLYFDPPTLTSAVGSTTISFSHKTENNSTSFFGYEFYYLLIDAANEVFLAKCTSQIDNYLTSKSPSELIPIIKNLGFKSLAGFDDDDAIMGTIPLFYIAQSGVDLDIDFQIPINDDFGTVSVTGAGSTHVIAPAYVRRASKKPSGEFRSFANLTEDDIADNGDTVYSTPEPDEVIFRGYIFALGRTSSLGEVFSYPVRIGDEDEPTLAEASLD